MLVHGPQAALAPGQRHEFEWRIPDLMGDPAFEIGLEFTSEQRASGTVILDYLTWDGEPEVTFTRPRIKAISGGRRGSTAWITLKSWGEPFRLIQDYGTGLLLTGTRRVGAITPFPRCLPRTWSILAGWRHACRACAAIMR